MRKFACVVLCLLDPSESHAVTGAELIESKNPFNIGYVWGAAEMRVGIKHTDDEAFLRLHDCFTKSGISANTLYDFTVAFIRRNPKFLALPGLAAVNDTIVEMCPAN
ncbi:hypothetical protein [Rhizobium leguminosarum]